jgi:RNase P subunit RPR2
LFRLSRHIVLMAIHQRRYVKKLLNIAIRMSVRISKKRERTNLANKFT